MGIAFNYLYLLDCVYLNAVTCKKMERPEALVYEIVGKVQSCLQFMRNRFFSQKTMATFNLGGFLHCELSNGS